MLTSVAVAFALLSTSSAPAKTHSGSSWQSEMERQLPLLGHRNWLVVADSAYPWQTSPGITTIVTNSDQLTVVRAALKAVGRCTHVRSTIFIDKELKYVPENEAHGVTAYRNTLAQIFKGREITPMLHEDIIGKLDEAGKSFHVLLLKTKMTIPYTSVFMRLDCAYWGDASEKRMREAMGKG